MHLPKVQGELKAVTEERDKNNAALEEQSKLLKNLQGWLGM